MSDAAGTPDVWDNNKWLASDHVEFADKVEAVINSPEVKSILLSLMARAQKRQSEAATQPAEAQLS